MALVSLRSRCAELSCGGWKGERANNISRHHGADLHCHSCSFLLVPRLSTSSSSVESERHSQRLRKSPFPINRNIHTYHILSPHPAAWAAAPGSPRPSSPSHQHQAASLSSPRSPKRSDCSGRRSAWPRPAHLSRAHRSDGVIPAARACCVRRTQREACGRARRSAG